jgi:hypothetical protein
MLISKASFEVTCMISQQRAKIHLLLPVAYVEPRFSLLVVQRVLEFMVEFFPLYRYTLACNEA